MSDSVLQRSQALRAKFFEDEQELLEALAWRGQSPDTMFIGCSDSRVVPEALLGARPGDVFVVRVVANIVPPHIAGQYAVGAAIEYGVLHLKVKHIIVCGHTDCGGVKALDQAPALTAEPSIAGWLKFARPAQKKVDVRGAAGADRHRAIIEENVLLQLENLQTYPVVRDALARKQVELHGWVYDLTAREIHYYDPAQHRFLVPF